MSGFDVCRQIKKIPTMRTLPVIMVTARASEDDRVRGLQLGADDYVTKPFSLREIVLRICRSIGRHRPIAPVKEKLRAGDFTLDELQHEARVKDRILTLTAVEFKLLALLMENYGLVLDRSKLLESVWGYGRNVSTRTVDTHVMRLRAKLGDAGEFIETVRGVGYRLQRADQVLPVPKVAVEDRCLVLT
jgi:two-component system phosphate regulon response regulator PhoB